MILISQKSQYDPDQVINSRNSTATPKNFSIITLLARACKIDIYNLSQIAAGGIVQLFKGTISLNPTISVAISSVTGTYAVAETVTDANGSTGVVLTQSATLLTLTSVVMVSPHQSFSGTITGGTSGATSTAGAFSWVDQTVNLSQGNNFIDVNPIISVLTGADAPPIAMDLEIWSGIGRTGTLFFTTSIGSGVDSLQKLTSASSFISYISGDIQDPNPNTFVPKTLYVTLGTVENKVETVQLAINGTVQN